MTIKNAFDTSGPSIFSSTKDARRNFGRNNGARGGAIPEFIKPKPSKLKPKDKKCCRVQRLTT